MSDESRYQKTGASVVLTRVRGERAIAAVVERGVSGRTGERFFAASLEPPETVEPPDPAGVLEVEEQIDSASAGSVIERLLVVEGSSAHEWSTGGERMEWEERHARLIATMRAAGGALRVPLLRGGATAGELEAGEVALVAKLLANRGKAKGAPTATVRLEASVMSELAASLAASPRIAPRVPLRQETHPSWALDGNGRPIRPFDPAGSGERPNVYRPSYRSPAVPALFHAEIAAEGGTAGDPELEAVEPIATARWSEREAVIDVLCSREGRGCAARLTLPVASLAALGRAAGERRWFPRGAGAWGRPAIAVRVRVEPW